MTPQQRTDQTLMKLAPAFAEKVRTVLAAMEKLGYPMVAYDGLRTTARQQELYRIGRNGDKRKTVTNCDGVRKRSRHQDAVAVDCAFLLKQPTLRKQWDLTWQGPWEAYGRIAEELGLQWLGDEIGDKPHIEERRRGIRSNDATAC